MYQSLGDANLGPTSLQVETPGAINFAVPGGGFLPGYRTGGTALAPVVSSAQAANWPKVLLYGGIGLAVLFLLLAVDNGGGKK